MKKNILLQFIPFLAAIISLIIITLIWEKIKLPFDNPKEIVGFYSLNSHHYMNDTLRFILFNCIRIHLNGFFIIFIIKCLITLFFSILFNVYVILHLNNYIIVIIKIKFNDYFFS